MEDMAKAYSTCRQKNALVTLMVVNSASQLLAIGLFFTLDVDERVTVTRGVSLTAVGFVYFMTLFELLNVFCMSTEPGHRFRHKYRLSIGDVLDINNKVVSGVQAVLCSCAGGAACASACSRDLLAAQHAALPAYAWFGAAYFFYNIWSMYTVHLYMNSKYTDQLKQKIQKKVKNGDTALSSGDSGPATAVDLPRKVSFFAYCLHEPVILLHHAFIGGFGFLIIVYLRGDLGDCIFGFVYLMEMSTPFVSLRGVLSRLKLKGSRVYLINGLLMLATFFVCRVLSLPYVCLLYSRHIGVTYMEAVASLPTGCKISICLLLLPQLYWFYLMCWGAVKVLFVPGGSDASPAHVARPAAGDAGQQPTLVPR